MARQSATRHSPLYRQSAILERETGIELSRATLDGWVMRVGELLRPISGAMAQELLVGNYIQADETPVGVQSERARGKNHQAYLWQYSRPGAAVVFDFRMGREREGPKRFLGNFEGILQSDGYAATIKSVAQRSCTQRVGHMRGASFSRPWSSNLRTRTPSALSRRWMNFLPLMPRHAKKG